VYGIVKQSGGDICVTSKLGEGTIFKIYFPRVEKPAEEVVTGSWLSEAPGGSETILVVEDEDMVRRLVCETLQRKGYSVLEAANGEKALLVCKQQPCPIHIMVTDRDARNERSRVSQQSGFDTPNDEGIVHVGILGRCCGQRWRVGLGLDSYSETLRPGGVGVEGARSWDARTPLSPPRALEICLHLRCLGDCVDNLQIAISRDFL
jgi:hypothetical protein